MKSANGCGKLKQWGRAFKWQLIYLKGEWAGKGI